MDDIQDLKKRVDHIQYDEINPIKDEINDMKITLSNNDLLTKQAVDSVKKLGDTMDSFKDTLIDIAQSVKDSNRINGEITRTIEDMNNRVSSLEKNTKERLDEIDEKSKIDILTWIKTNFVGIFLAIGSLSYAVSQHLK